MSVRFWHKADVRPSNKNTFFSNKRVSGGTPSIGLTPSPVLEVLCKPTLTLFFKNTLSILARKIFLEIKYKALSVIT